MFLVLYEAGTWHISLECVERHVHATSNREEVERGLTLMGVCERTISRDKKQVCFTTTDWDAARELGGVHSGSVVDNGCIWCSSAEVGVLERNTQRRLCLQCPLKAPCFSVQENLDLVFRIRGKVRSYDVHWCMFRVRTSFSHDPAHSDANSLQM